MARWIRQACNPLLGRLTLVAMTAAALTLAGCERSSSGAGTGSGLKPTVVDLDAVAKAVGEDERIKQALRSYTEQLNEQLTAAGENMKEEIRLAQQEYEQDPTEENERAVQLRQARAQRNVQANKLRAQQAINRRRQQLVADFRRRLEPAVERVAEEEGAAVVAVANDNVIWFDEAADITDEVIAALRADPGLLEAPDSDSGAEDEAGAGGVTGEAPDAEAEGSTVPSPGIEPGQADQPEDSAGSTDQAE